MSVTANSTKIDNYIGSYPPNVQAKLQQIREVIKGVAPEATETISYGIPTFDLKGKHLVHFAAFKNHLSLFPTSSGVYEFEDELKDCRTSKGTIQFPLVKEIPFDLIKRITEFRRDEIMNVAKR